MDDDNFYDLQDDWKAEIDETLHEIREREKIKDEYGTEFLALKHESRILGHSSFPVLYVVSPWWNRLDSVLFGPLRTSLALS